MTNRNVPCSVLEFVNIKSIRFWDDLVHHNMVAASSGEADHLMSSWTMAALMKPVAPITKTLVWNSLYDTYHSFIIVKLGSYQMVIMLPIIYFQVIYLQYKTYSMKITSKKMPIRAHLIHVILHNIDNVLSRWYFIILTKANQQFQTESRDSVHT